MKKKNSSFAASLAAGIDLNDDAPTSRRPGIAANVLTGRTNRIADLVSGAVVTRTHELVDPARCKMWEGHNRDYALLTEEKCADLIDSIKSQGRQEIPAIVRRISGDPLHDFEVICGARRHWTISWLRAHNYPEFKFLVDVREMGDEEAFRIADIENRARDDLSDYERAKDYLRALGLYYEGTQKAMAQRLNVSESWLTRYLDLARLPAEILQAFPEPQNLGVRNAIALKALLKVEGNREPLFVAAKDIGQKQLQDGKALPVVDVIKYLESAVLAPKKSGKAKGKGSAPLETYTNAHGHPILRLEGADTKAIRLTLLPKGGSSRADAERMVKTILDQYWKD